MIQSTSKQIGDLMLYKLMADETRLRILKMLNTGEKSVGEISRIIGVSQPLISHKLKDLRENGLVNSYRSGKNIIYKLSGNQLSYLLEVGENAGTGISSTCECVECEEQEK